MNKKNRIFSAGAPLPRVRGYEIEREISRGGFGCVYLARRHLDNRQVAVKVLQLPNDANVERFYREAKVLHRELANPHVVDLIEADFSSSPPFIVMEYCRGQSLDTWVADRRGWRDVALALAHAAEGLHSIHASRGFHRDIKPGNLLLTAPFSEGGVVKVGDFGLARLPTASLGPMTQSPWGTEGYIAPEVHVTRNHTSQADIYSLGITGIELLTGQRDPQALGQAGGPVILHNFLRQMVALNPTQRPTMAECALLFQQMTEVPAPSAAVPATAGRQSNRSGLGWVLGGLATLGLVLAAASANKKDANGRFHGRDGRYRGGRWG